MSKQLSVCFFFPIFRKTNPRVKSWLQGQPMVLSKYQIKVASSAGRTSCLSSTLQPSNALPLPAGYSVAVGEFTGDSEQGEKADS